VPRLIAKSWQVRLIVHTSTGGLNVRTESVNVEPAMDSTVLVDQVKLVNLGRWVTNDLEGSYEPG
jgi:hypothetical protein